MHKKKVLSGKEDINFILTLWGKLLKNQQQERSAKSNTKNERVINLYWNKDGLINLLSKLRDTPPLSKYYLTENAPLPSWW